MNSNVYHYKYYVKGRKFSEKNKYAIEFSNSSISVTETIQVMIAYAAEKKH